MQSRTLIIIGITTLAVIIVIVIAAVALVPQETNPAFTTAVTFVESVGRQADSAALALLNDEMQAYVTENCADSRPSACIDTYIPDEWGAMRSAVFRRAAPDGSAWNVEVIAHYEQAEGASGMCSLIRVAEVEGGGWRVAGWAGFVHCGEANSRDMATNPDTPNRAP